MRKILKNLTKGEILALVATFALLAAFCAYLVLHVKDARREGAFDRRPPIGSLFSGTRQGMPNEPDPMKIEAWMTFKYVNVVFDLPDGLLKDSLKIEDKSYPNLSIGRYVKKTGANRDEFLNSVRETVEANWKSPSQK